MKLNIFGNLPVYLIRDPLEPMEAATKQYVDASIVDHAGNLSLHITSVQNTFLDGLTISATEANYLSGTTSSVQTQLDSKVAKAGDTMTGFLTLHADPTSNLHAATKQYVDTMDAVIQAQVTTIQSNLSILNADPVTKTYVDTQDATKVSKSGSTMTGELVLAGDPIASLQAATKQYVDTSITTHTSDSSIHITATQNTLLDNLNATHTELNYLIGTTSSVQTQLDSKLPLSGGTLTGNLSMGNGSTISVTATPSLSTDVVNKTYVDSLISGLKWKPPILDSNLAGINLNTPELNPAEGTSYIVGSEPTGSWAAFANRLVTYKNSAWTDVLGRAVLVGDRIGVGFEIDSLDLDASVAAYDNKIITIATTSPVTITETVSAEYDTALVTDSDSFYFGTTYTYTIESGWVRVSSTINFATGTGLSITGGVLHLNLSSGITEDIVGGVSNIKANLFPSRGLFFTEDGDVASTSAAAGIAVKIDNTSLTFGDGGTIGVSAALQTTIENKLFKYGDTMTGFLTLSGNPTANLHAATKQYVDSADASLTSQITGVQSIVAVLNADPVTRTYVDTQDGTKVAKTGDTMTGFLTLSGNPTSNLHAATKQYVDSVDTAIQTQLNSVESTVNVLNADPVTRTYVDNQDATKVAKAGDSMTGLLTLSANPTANLHAATKQYVDSADTIIQGQVTTLQGTVSGLSADPVTKTYVDTQDGTKVAKAGDTMTGLLTLSANPTANLHAATKQYVDSTLNTHTTNDTLHITSAQNTFLDAITVSSAEVNRLTGVTSDVQTQIDGKVAKAGDTMTGALVLAANPVANLEAATKQYVDAADTTIQTQVNSIQTTVNTLNTDPVTKNYVDNNLANKVNKAGDSMSGYLSLVGTPTLPLHATTKQYVDNLVQGLNSKPAVRYATSTTLDGTYTNGTLGVNSTIISNSNGALTVDGGNVIAGDRILVKAQTNAKENGSYIVQQVGDAVTPWILKRIETIDESIEVPGAYFYVYDGVLKGTGWLLTVVNPETFTIGTDEIFVNQFSGAGTYIGGAGLVLSGTTFNIITASQSRIVVTNDSIDLALTGVVAGSYTKTTVDAYGRVTSGSNPITLAGYGIIDAQPLNSKLTALSNVSGNGILVKIDDTTSAAKAIGTSGVGLSITNPDGIALGNITIASNATAANSNGTIVSRDSSGNFAANTITADLTGVAASATILETARNFSVTGDVTAPAVSFNGSAEVALATTLSDTGVVAGTYTKVTVDAKGRITLGANPTTVEGYGLVDAATIDFVNAKFAELEGKLLDLHNLITARLV